MYQLIDYIQSLSVEALFTMILVLSMFGALLGMMTNAIMGKRGFGIAGNGFLVIVGIALGLHLARLEFGELDDNNIIKFSILAGASSTVLLLLLGGCKRVIGMNQ